MQLFYNWVHKNTILLIVFDIDVNIDFGIMLVDDNDASILYCISIAIMILETYQSPNQFYVVNMGISCAFRPKSWFSWFHGCTSTCMVILSPPPPPACPPPTPHPPMHPHSPHNRV